MMNKRTTYTFSRCQFKSLETVQRFCAALSEIEEITGIRECNIALENVFICPWIDLEELNKTEMERLIRDVLKKL